MSLNDEIGSFSKRREVEVVPKKEDSYENDDDSYDFKMYTLDDLEAFNEEQQEVEELISPWWKNIRSFFRKSTLRQMGIVEYKRKSLLSDDTFEDVYIDNAEESLEELKIFAKSIKKSYWRRFTSELFWIAFYILLASWTGWNMIWYFLLGWSSVRMFKHYLKYLKENKWLLKAESFIVSQNGNREENKRESEDSTLNDVLAFNAFISKEENAHWSIKVYDTVANLFTRKK